MSVYITNSVVSCSVTFYEEYFKVFDTGKIDSSSHNILMLVLVGVVAYGGVENL